MRQLPGISHHRIQIRLGDGDLWTSFLAQRFQLSINQERRRPELVGDSGEEVHFRLIVFLKILDVLLTDALTHKLRNECNQQ